MIISSPPQRHPPDNLKAIPRTPGVYHMLDAQGGLLYIGKAVNLRARLQSYFRRAQVDPWVADLVSRIVQIEIQQYGSELEALLQEARQIRERQPYFNRMLKNSKKQAYLRVSDHLFPSLSAELEPGEDGAIYLGPFPSRRYLENRFPVLLAMLKLRSCNDAMLARHQRTGNPCLEYSLGRCGAPCVGYMSPVVYQQQVFALLGFLQGSDNTLLDHRLAEREQAVETLYFERAAQLQEQIEMLRSLQRTGSRLVYALQRHYGFLLLSDVGEDTVRVLMLVGGVPVRWESLSRQASMEEIQALVSDFFERLGKHVPQAYLADKVQYEETLILARWLAQPGHQDAVLFRSNQSSRRLAQQFQALLRRFNRNKNLSNRSPDKL